MEEIDHPPLAPALMDSMRSMGYSLGSAFADLLDNSIAKNGRKLEIEFRAEEPLHVAIIDDGDGMSSETLQEAMRHGSRNPLDPLGDSDLGRFGLGLKTASLSQCRKMTVVSLRDGELSAYCWDLDLVNKARKWVLLRLDPKEAKGIKYVDRLLSNRKGTLVLWEKLDRLVAGELDAIAGLGAKIDEAREHLALVFHRYLEGEAGLRKISISVNGTELLAQDPFLAHHALTQKLADDQFWIEGRRLKVKPFILPHPSRLSPEDARRAGGAEGLRAHQGFYVYRQRRLIIWGTWFRLARKDELSRLARVRVDIPNSLDHLWTLDIRKSVATPPEEVRNQLRRTVERIREKSRVVHENRGHAERSGPIERGWNRVSAGGSVRYDINRKHSIVRLFSESLNDDQRRQFESVLRVIETSFPIESIYVDVASDQRPRNSADAKEVLLPLVKDVLCGLAQDSPIRAVILMNLHEIEPFSAHPKIAKEIASELQLGERQ